MHRLPMSYLKDTFLCLSCGGANTAMAMKAKTRLTPVPHPSPGGVRDSNPRVLVTPRSHRSRGGASKSLKSGAQVSPQPQESMAPGSSYLGLPESEWEITPKEFSCYFTRYHHITSPGEYLTGEKARQFFLQTKIPLDHLSHIWDLSDVNKDGCLDAAEFSVAMHLVQRYLQGFSLPPTLPLPLTNCYHVSLKPHLPIATEKHVLKCKKVFEAFAKDIAKGTLAGESARRLLAKSNLSKDQLRHIWILSDQDEDDCLNFVEFTVAMHLVFTAKLGYILPVTLDPYTIFPPAVIKLLQDLMQTDDDSLFSSVSLCRHSDIPYPPSEVSLFSLPQMPGICRENYSGNPFRSEEELVSLDDSTADLLPQKLAQTSVRTKQEYNNNAGSGRTRSGSSGFSGAPTSSNQPPQKYQISTGNRHDSQHDSQQDNSHAIDHTYHGTATAGHDLPGTGTGRSSTTYGQQRQTRTGFRRGMTDYSDSDDSIEYLGPTRLSIIHEETSEDDGSRCESHPTSPLSPLSPHSRSHDSQHRSHDFRLGSHDPHLSHDLERAYMEKSFSQDYLEEGNDGVPWYQGNSQDDWQTTPAYCPKGAWSDDTMIASAQRKAHFVNNALKFVVTEETVPVLQVPTAVAISAESLALDHSEELMRKDIEELNQIAQASKKLLAEFEDGAELDVRGAEMRDTSKQELASKGVVQEDWYNQSVESVLKGRGIVKAADEGCGSLQGLEVFDKLDGLEAEMLSYAQTDSDHEVGVAKNRSHDFADGGSGGTQVKEKSHDKHMRSHDWRQGSHDLQWQSHDRKEVSLDHQYLVQGPLYDHTQSICDVAPIFNTTASNTLTKSPDIIVFPPPEEPEALVQEVKRTGGSYLARKPGQVPSRQRQRVGNAKMDDLDSLFEGELADINQVFQEFEVKDKKKEMRSKTEEEDLKQVPAKPKDATDAALTLEAFEEVSKRRSVQSMNIEQQWEEEMQKLEEERLKALEQQQTQDDADDSLLQDLDDQLKTLIQTKEQEVKIAQKIAQENKILKEQREKEERERKEKERLDRLARAKDSPLADGDMELTVEEWIAWMEEKKKQGMTPAQQEEYERRKKAYQVKRREREEKLRLEEEEKRRKTREKIESEMISYSQRQKEVIESRLTEEELRQKQEELAQRQLEEAKIRKERGVRMRQEDRERELEELKPKARSALAARWEESVKLRSNGKPLSREDHKATVITGKKSPEFQIDKEEERLTRRISGSYLNGGVTLSPEKKRQSLQ